MGIIPEKILKKPLRWRCNKRFDEVSEGVNVGGKAAEALSEAEAERCSENYRETMELLEQARELARVENPYLERREQYEKALSEAGLFSDGADEVQSRLKKVKRSLREERYDEAEEELDRAEEEMRRVLASAAEEVFDLRGEGTSCFVEGKYGEAAERWREAARKFGIIAGFERSGVGLGHETEFERSPEEYVDETQTLADLAELGAKVSTGRVERVGELRSETRSTFDRVEEENVLNSVDVSGLSGADPADFRDRFRRLRNDCRALGEGEGERSGRDEQEDEAKIRKPETVSGSTSSGSSGESVPSETDGSEKSPYTLTPDNESDEAPEPEGVPPRQHGRSVSEGIEEDEATDRSGLAQDSTPSGSESKSCPKCGTELDESTVFCVECGTYTEEEDVVGGKDIAEEGVEKKYERGEEKQVKSENPDAYTDTDADTDTDAGTAAESDEELTAAGRPNREEAGSGSAGMRSGEERPVADTSDEQSRDRRVASDASAKESVRAPGASFGKNCPECRGAVGGENSFCTSCGADLRAGKATLEGADSCPECGEPVSDEDSFCTSCGADFGKAPANENGSICPECGESVDEDNSFCTSCGAVLSSPEAATSPAERVGEEPGTSTVRSQPDTDKTLSVEYADVGEKTRIGSGGGADVYRAEYRGRHIALKEPRMAGTLHMEDVEQFIEEAETWEKLDDHENIVTVLDYASQPVPWIAMEYMDAGHLGDRASKMGLEQAVWTATSVIEAVHHAHRRGVAHLDLKPENVLFKSVRGGRDVPKVTDWGMSKHLMRHSESVKGLSPHYAAPEQFDEEEYGNPDDLTDVYQLGAVFYELFTGQPPFVGDPSTVMFEVLHGDVEPPSEVNPDLPEKLDGILLKALEKDRYERHETVLYLRDDLQGLYESV